MRPGHPENLQDPCRAQLESPGSVPGSVRKRILAVKHAEMESEACRLIAVCLVPAIIRCIFEEAASMLVVFYVSGV